MISKDKKVKSSMPNLIFQWKFKEIDKPLDPVLDSSKSGIFYVFMGTISDFFLCDHTSLPFILDYFLINLKGLVFVQVKISVLFIFLFNPPANSLYAKSHWTAYLSQCFPLFVKLKHFFFIFFTVS